METEQKQKKLLFAGLTILVLAGIFLYSTSLLDRNTPVIQSAEPQSLVPTDPVPVVPQPQRIKAAEPVIVAEDWKTYKNVKYGFEFRYPKEWPAPVLTVPTQETDTAFLNYESVRTLWHLGVGKQEAACEGELCHLLTMEGYDAGGFNSHQNFQQALIEDLKEDELAWIESEDKLNGADAIVFASGGMCGYRNAYVFSKQMSLYFTAHCGQEDPELGAMFDAILSTLKLTK